MAYQKGRAGSVPDEFSDVDGDDYSQSASRNSSTGENRGPSGRVIYDDSDEPVIVEALNKCAFNLN